MKISGEYTFDAPQALVWDAIRDPAVLGSVLPGGEAFDEVGENEYTGVLKVKIGPVQGTFQGKIQLSDIVPPESYSIVIDGTGAQGFVQGSGDLKLAAAGEQTHMVYVGDAQVGGRIASVGQRLVDKSAESIIRQSLNGLNEYLKIQVEKQAAIDAPAASSGTKDGTVGAVDTAPAVTELPEYVPPSQSQLAMNVAKDVAGDIIPSALLPWLILGGLVLLGLLAAWLVS